MLKISSDLRAAIHDQVSSSTEFWWCSEQAKEGRWQLVSRVLTCHVFQGVESLKIFSSCQRCVFFCMCCFLQQLGWSQSPLPHERWVYAGGTCHLVSALISCVNLKTRHHWLFSVGYFVRAAHEVSLCLFSSIGCLHGPHRVRFTYLVYSRNETHENKKVPIFDFSKLSTTWPVLLPWK